MQLHGEPDLQVNAAEPVVTAPRKRRSTSPRKVTVRLTEELYERLTVATDRPGVGKSSIMEAALERFLAPGPSIEEQVRDRFDDMQVRFDRLEYDIQVMAETVALHARYHLAVMPLVPESQQRKATLHGDERFKVLAQQVDRRVRMGKPLVQETLERLDSADHGGDAPAIAEDRPHKPSPGPNNRHSFPEGMDIERASATAGEGAGNIHQRSHALPRRHEGDEAPKPRAKLSNSAREFMEDSATSNSHSPSKWRSIFAVFLPFAAGYFLSYLFRTINASISPALTTEFGLDAANNGLLASVYFVVFAVAQIPIGVLLDRYGPRRVQSVLLVIAAGGATLFGTADGFVDLLAGRAMIGLGVAAALMAGLKAVVTWFPKERIALVNGCMIMLGTLGAVTATAPTDWLLNWIGWRNLFGILTLATVITAGLIYLIVPESDTNPATSAKKVALRSIFTDPRFLRIAPLSAACIGSSWALQSLWAASWLTDVEGFDRPSLINQLFMMAVGMSVGALLLGLIADRLRKRGVATEILLAVAAGVFILAELALVLRLPLPSILPWSVVSVMGAATVLSYATIAEYFPKEVAARANGALNLLHFGWAFLVQYGTGLILSHWASQDGHYPAIAYQYAFGLSLALQAAALVWFAIPWFRSFAKYIAGSFAPRNLWQDDQAGFIAVPVDGPILEVQHATEW